MLPKLTPADLKPGELEIVDCSPDIFLYECGHWGAASFRLLMGVYDLRSPIIAQDEFCPGCAFKHTCEKLVRCPTCHKIYEASNGYTTSITSFYHLVQCLPNCIKTIRY